MSGDLARDAVLSTNSPRSHDMSGGEDSYRSPKGMRKVIIDTVDPVSGHRLIYIDDTHGLDDHPCKSPSATRYTSDRCRCFACRAAHAAAQRLWQQRKTRKV